MSSIDYAQVSRCWRRNKSALTRARNRNDDRKVLEVCEQAFSDFEAFGYPDDWALFKRAGEDAAWRLRREEES